MRILGMVLISPRSRIDPGSRPSSPVPARMGRSWCRHLVRSPVPGDQRGARKRACSLNASHVAAARPYASQNWACIGHQDDFISCQALQQYADLSPALLHRVRNAGSMQNVEVAIQIEHRNGMRSGRQAEVLIYICSGIPTKLNVVIPHLHLADRH